MDRSSKQQQRGHICTVHQRLYNALNLGLRSFENERRKFHWSDVGMQRLVVRSIDTFLDCISAETLNYPIVKGSVPDMVGALEGILDFKSEAMLTSASNMVVKMINVLPRSMLQPHLLDLICPLASLLPSHQFPVAVSCATALNSILSNLSVKKVDEVWEILKDTNTVFHISKIILDFSAGSKPIEYFKVIISLLSKILWRWPNSRYCIWSNAELMDVLGAIILTPDSSVKVAVLQLYTSLGLCGSGAQKLLEREETVKHIVEHCMANSNSISVQMESFRFAQCLALNEHKFLKMMGICCEPVVNSIINAMSDWRSHSGKVPKDQMHLLMEACRLSLVTRWAGEHQKYFWKLGIEKVLLNLIWNNRQPHQTQHLLSVEEKIAVAQRGLEEKFLLGLRPYIWDILGGLAAHCPENLKPEVHENEISVNLLITCVCLEFVDSVRNSRQLFQSDTTELYRNESVCRSVLMMIYSASRYISDQARFILSEILNPSDKWFLNYVLDKLNKPRNKFGELENLTVINLMSLACLSSLPQYREDIINCQGVRTLMNFLKRCLSHDLRMNSSTAAPHFRNGFSEKTCCWVHMEEWDGEYSPLLFCLWNIAELMIHHSGLVEYNEAQLVSELQKICLDISAPGPRWYAARILGYFGFYGFPNKYGKRIGKALNENELSDLKLLVADAEPFSVHSVILMGRCPSLLPPEAHPLNERSSNVCMGDSNDDWEISKREVRLSAHVDYRALLKLLEYVYSGHLQAEGELVGKLRILARHCNLQYLLQMLCHVTPRWGTPFPSFDFTYALGPAGYSSSDIILESKANDQIQWRCRNCSLSVPYMHVHRVILSSSSWYFRALFLSGMRESHARTIKVPLTWKALEKLVNWFYSDNLPKPVSGCSWDNLDVEEKLSELHPYVELLAVAKVWCLDDVHEECTKLIMSCLDSTKQLCIQMIKIAIDFSLWEIAEAAANYIAPMYQYLRKTGELEELDEELIEMVRSASVRLSQEGDGKQ